MSMKPRERAPYAAILDRSLSLLERLSLAPQGLALAALCRDCEIAKGTAHRRFAVTIIWQSHKLWRAHEA